MSAQRRVCQLIKGLGRGGAESLLPQVVAASSDEWSHAVAYFLPWKDALVNELRAAGASVRCLPARGPVTLLLQVPRVAAWLRREKADLLHCHLPLAGLVGRLAATLVGVPVVYTEHNLQQRYHPWTRRANRWTWGMQTRVVAVSAEVARSARLACGEKVPIRVVHNGIRMPREVTPQEVAEVRHAAGFPTGARVVGTVAVMRSQKRLDLWLRAAARLAEDDPGVRFLVVGDGPLRGELEESVARLELASRLHFAGLRDDVAPYLRAMDVFLSSSQFEGLPLALLEAMAANRPVVATAVGGVGEVVRDGKDGLLVPFADADAVVAALAAACRRLLTDAGTSARFAAAGRCRVERDFSVGRMARQLEDVYHAAIEGGGR